MHKSKLPLRYWFIAMHLLTSTKKSFSVAELQRQLSHKRYHPIWHMLHKLREAMGKHDGECVLAGRIELDEGYLKMKVIENSQKEIINAQVQKLASNATEIDSDDSTSYVDLKDFVPKHNAQVIPKENTGEVLT